VHTNNSLTLKTGLLQKAPRNAVDIEKTTRPRGEIVMPREAGYLARRLPLARKKNHP